MTLLALLIKTRKQCMAWNNIAFVPVMLFVFCGLYFLLVGSRALSVVFISYGIILIESRIALRSLIRGFPGARILVTLLRAAFFFIPLPFLGFPTLNPVSWGVLAGIACGLLLQLPQLSDLRLILSDAFIAILPPLTKEERLDGVLLPTLSAIAQEYFYRGIMLYVLASYIGPWAIIAAALLFTFEHLMHLNTRRAFDKYDLLLQTFLGLGLGSVFYLSGSLAGCMLGHIVYNGASALQALRRKSK